MNTLKIGAQVNLVPLEGGYQKTIPATVIRVTPKRVVVEGTSERRIRTFRKSDAREVGNNDFPRRRLEVAAAEAKA